MVETSKQIIVTTQNLSVDLGEEPSIVFTQENSMENSLQDLFYLYSSVLVCTTTILLLL